MYQESPDGKLDTKPYAKHFNGSDDALSEDVIDAFIDFSAALSFPDFFVKIKNGKLVGAYSHKSDTFIWVGDCTVDEDCGSWYACKSYYMISPRFIGQFRERNEKICSVLDDGMRIYFRIFQPTVPSIRPIPDNVIPIDGFDSIAPLLAPWRSNFRNYMFNFNSDGTEIWGKRWRLSLPISLSDIGAVMVCRSAVSVLKIAQEGKHFGDRLSVNLYKSGVLLTGRYMTVLDLPVRPSIFYKRPEVDLSKPLAGFSVNGSSAVKYFDYINYVDAIKVKIDGSHVKLCGRESDYTAVWAPKAMNVYGSGDFRIRIDHIPLDLVKTIEYITDLGAANLDIIFSEDGVVLSSVNGRLDVLVPRVVRKKQKDAGS